MFPCNFTYYLVNSGSAGFTKSILLKASIGTNVRMVEAFGSFPICQSIQHFSEQQDFYIYGQWRMNHNVYGNPLALLKGHQGVNVLSCAQCLKSTSDSPADWKM